jgi:hypothetical protein
MKGTPTIQGIAKKAIGMWKKGMKKKLMKTFRQVGSAPT